MLIEFQKAWAYDGEIRRAKDAREYAELVKEVGKEADVPVVDLWTLFMEKAGWKGGEELPGEEKLGKNEILAELLADGEFSVVFHLY